MEKKEYRIETYIKSIYDNNPMLKNKNCYNFLLNYMIKIDETKYDKELDIENEISLNKQIEIKEKYYINDSSENYSTQFSTQYINSSFDFLNDNIDETNFENEKKEEIKELAENIIEEIINQEFNVRLFICMFMNNFTTGINCPSKVIISI